MRARTSVSASRSSGQRNATESLKLLKKYFRSVIEHHSVLLVSFEPMFRVLDEHVTAVLDVRVKVWIGNFQLEQPDAGLGVLFDVHIAAHFGRGRAFWEVHRADVFSVVVRFLVCLVWLLNVHLKQY